MQEQVTTMDYRTEEGNANGSRGENEDGDTSSDGGRALKRPRSDSSHPASCEICKQRKVKCDRTLPKCGWCARNDHLCVYRERQPPGLRAGYGRRLESRMDEVDKVLEAQQRVLHELQGQLSLIPLQTPVQPSEHVVFNANNVLDDDRCHTGRLLGENFPPEDLLFSLTNLFFDHINPWCPILHRESTFNLLFGSNACEEPDRVLLHAMTVAAMRFSVDGRLSPEARQRYYTISKQRVFLYCLENTSVKALQALVILAFDIIGDSNGPPGWNVLALLTQSAIRLGLAAETNSTSTLTDLSMPSIHTLRAVVLPPPATFIEDESRRRLFWAIYILNRYATISTSFGFGPDDQEIDLKLPIRDDLLARGLIIDTPRFNSLRAGQICLRSQLHVENVGAFGMYIEVLGILSRVHEFLRKPVDITLASDVETWQAEYRSLDSRLNSWASNLPANLRFSYLVRSLGSDGPAGDSLRIMLHVAYYTTIIRIHSSAAYPTIRSSYFAPSSAASQKCLAAVRKLCDICDIVQDFKLITRLGPPFAFSVWVACRTLLVHSSTVDLRIDPSIGRLIETLRALGMHWKVARSYVALLERVLNEWQMSNRKEQNRGGSQDLPASVAILADMRRCAYDLEVLMSRQSGHRTDAVRTDAVRTDAIRASSVPLRTSGTVLDGSDCLDLFDFFNLPYLQTPFDASTTDLSYNPDLHLNGLGPPGSVWFPSYLEYQDLFANMHTDWVSHGPQFG